MLSFGWPHSSSYFQVLQSLYQSFDDCTKSTNYNWYNRHFHVPQFFQFPIPCKFFIPVLTDVFHWSSSDSKSPISRTLLSIVFDLNSVVVCMISILPLRKHFQGYQLQLVSPLPICPTVFSRSWYLFIFPLSFIFILCSAGTANSANSFLRVNLH